jgi:hypothetical protein
VRIAAGDGKNKFEGIDIAWAPLWGLTPITATALVAVGREPEFVVNNNERVPIASNDFN